MARAMRLDTFTPEVRAFILASRTCLSCGTELLIEQDRGYCSMECHNAKSPTIAYIEHRFKAPIRKVLVTALNTYPTLIGVSEVLGVSRWTVINYMKEYNIKRFYK